MFLKNVTFSAILKYFEILLFSGKFKVLPAVCVLLIRITTVYIS